MQVRKFDNYFKLNNLKSKLILIINFILFKVLLDYTYVEFIHTNFASASLGYSLDFNYYKYTVGWLLYLFLSFILHKKKHNNTYVILVFVFIIGLAPIITLYSFRNESTISFLMSIIPYFFIFYFNKSKRKKVKLVLNGKKIGFLFSILIIVLVIYNYFKVVGLSSLNLNLNDVYVFRNEFDELNNSGVFGYLNNWVAKTINVFLIAYSIQNKKIYLTFIFVSIQILIFGLSGHKSVLLPLILLPVIYFIQNYRFKTNLILSLFSFLILGLIFYNSYSENIFLSSILLRRAFFVPANLNYIYIDFFSVNDFVFWSTSITKYFIHYPYSVNPSFVIGEYLGDPTMSANVGFVGSGYMQSGIFGIIIYTTIITSILNFINLINGINKWILTSIFIIPVLTVFISSDLFTGLLTHGLFISIFIVYLFNQKLSTNN